MMKWYDWDGKDLGINANSSVDFQVGALNSTKVLQTFTTDILADHDPNNAILKMSIETQGRKPNSNVTQTFKAENWFTPTGLNNATLVDPGLELSYSDETKNFTVMATQGVAAWVWLDYPAGAVLQFDDNGFWLLPNEKREVGYTVMSDTTDGKWTQGVTVQSIWNQTLAA